MAGKPEKFLTGKGKSHIYDGGGLWQWALCGAMPSDAEITAEPVASSCKNCKRALQSQLEHYEDVCRLLKQAIDRLEQWE